MTEDTATHPIPQPTDVSQTLRLAFVIGEILEDAKERPKNYVHEWHVPGGGE